MQSFLQFISSIIAPAPAPSSFDNPYPGEEDEETGSVSIDTTIKYRTEEEAHKAIVDSYYAFMEYHFGRKPLYTSDLYCNMVVTSHRGKRYWWIPVTHPVAVIVKNHFDDFDMDGSKGCIGTKQIGDCVIYEDKVIAFFVEEIVKLFENEGIEHQIITQKKHDSHKKDE
jgi:hypothetical protein